MGSNKEKKAVNHFTNTIQKTKKIKLSDNHFYRKVGRMITTITR